VILHGTIRALLLFDVSEEIDLECLRPLVGASATKREPAFSRPIARVCSLQALEKKRGLWARWTTLATSYESLLNEFHQSRAFFLEVMVVIILLIEIGFLFRGKG